MVQAKEKVGKTGTEIVLQELLSDDDRETLAKVTQVMQQLNGYFMEREDYVEIVFCARLAKQHTVSIGPPGTGKSYLIQCFNSHFTGSVYFQWQVNKFTVPEELFGIYSIPLMKEGRYERVTSGKLPEADIAYLDELFNANTSVLNALNGIMNERVFQGKSVPLESLNSATNFMPEEKTTVAFFDRFTYRLIVDQIHEAAAFERMLRLPQYDLHLSINGCPKEFITREEFAALQNKVEDVQIPAAVYSSVCKIREMLRIENLVPTDRRFKWALRAMQARALLYGRDICTQDDLWLLKSVLWTDPKEVPLVESIIMKSIDPDAARIKETYEQAVDIEKQLKPLDVDKDPTLFANVKEGLKKLDQIADTIRAMRTDKGKTMMPKVQQVAENLEARVRATRAQIAKDKMGA